MRLQTKLTLASAGIISALGVLVGGIAVASSEAAGIASVDKVIAAGADTISDEKNDKIAAALLVSSEAGDALEVAYIDPAGEFNNLSTSDEIIPVAPTEKQLTAASKDSITITQGLEEYRLRTIKVSKGEWLLLAMSLDDVIAARNTGLLALGGVTASAVLFGAASITLITRRETRKIARLTAEAERIASGDLNLDLTAEVGSSEVDRLSRALESMVESLQQAVKVERAAQERMHEFLGDASHELRTPLTVVRGYLEMIGKPELPDSARARAHERMSSEIQRMERLIRDLLQIAELSDATSANALVEQVDLSEVVATAAGDLEVMQPERKIEISVEPDLKVLGRDDLARQLLANLTGNIARHTNVSDRVRIELKRSGSRIQLTLDDAGPGLPNEAYGQNLDAFKRFDPSRSREHGGSGLGMSIINGIVRTFGGTIELSKSDLGGLRTEISLPAS